MTLKKHLQMKRFQKENDCYNIKGAVYGVYQSVEDAMQDANRVETLTTKEDGSSNTVTLRRGTYYVKELTASDGYLLCNEQEETLPAGIHAATVKSLETTTVNCKEEPASNPFDLSLQKLDLGSHSAEAPGNAALLGAIFEIAYYENVNGATDGTPAKKWYYRTDDTEHFQQRIKKTCLRLTRCRMAELYSPMICMSMMERLLSRLGPIPVRRYLHRCITSYPESCILLDRKRQKRM